MEAGNATKRPMGDGDWMIIRPMDVLELDSGRPISLASGEIVREIGKAEMMRTVVQWGEKKCTVLTEDLMSHAKSALDLEAPTGR